MQLKPQDGERLVVAIEQSLSPLEMPRLLQARFGLQFFNITTPYKDFSLQAFDLYQYFQVRNEVEKLIAALRDARPRIAEFVRLADLAGFAQLPGSGFEVLVRPAGSPYSDVEVLRTELAKREAAVCRVDLPKGHGTGCLVAGDLVLTNYHVMASALDQQGKLNANVTCLFDHKTSTQGYTTPGTPVKVTAVVAFSPFAAEDLDPSQENLDLQKLDYALLKLEAAVGNTPVVTGGDNRGVVPLPNPLRTAAQFEGLVILQHPGGKPMKIDIGAVTRTGATRLRHSVNTEPGSSGSPILDANLQLVAIHHAGHNWPKADHPFNQGIPMAHIVAHARQFGVQI